MLVEGLDEQRVGERCVREAALVAVDAVGVGLAVEELAGKVGVHVQTVLVLGAEAVQVELAGLELLVERRVVAERTLAALLAPTLQKELANDRLPRRLGRRRRLLLLPLLLQLTVLALLLHLLLDRLDRNQLTAVALVVTFALVRVSAA